MSLEKHLLELKAHYNRCLSQPITRVYLVEQSEHVSQQVRDRHVQELSKVIQVQLLALQLPGPVAVLLQNLLGVLRLQPGAATGNA